MSAKVHMRQMLDELMGTGRDGTKNPIHYSDPKVCRCFLLGLCPHEALAGTKMSLGACLKIHDYALKADFENSSKTNRSNQHRFYELTVLTYLQKVIRSCEVLDRAKKGRLTRCQSASWNGGANEKTVELKGYGEMVDKKLAQAEELGSEGKVEEALNLIREVDKLKRKRNRLERYLLRKSAEPAKEQKQNICEECHLCIGLDDNEQRVANHSSGRLHNSLLEMRRKIAELAASLEKAKIPGDWAKLEGAQFFSRPVSSLDLASTRARSYSPRDRSRTTSRRRSSRSWSRSSSSLSRSHSWSSRGSRGPSSRSRSRSWSGSVRRRRSYARSRSRSRHRYRSTSRSRSDSRESQRNRTKNVSNESWSTPSSTTSQCAHRETSPPERRNMLQSKSARTSDADVFLGHVPSKWDYADSNALRIRPVTGSEVEDPLLALSQNEDKVCSKNVEQTGIDRMRALAKMGQSWESLDEPPPTNERVNRQKMKAGLSGNARDKLTRNPTTIPTKASVPRADKKANDNDNAAPKHSSQGGHTVNGNGRKPKVDHVVFKDSVRELETKTRGDSKHALPIPTGAANAGDLGRDSLKCEMAVSISERTATLPSGNAKSRIHEEKGPGKTADFERQVQRVERESMRLPAISKGTTQPTHEHPARVAEKHPSQRESNHDKPLSRSKIRKKQCTARRSRSRTKTKNDNKICKQRTAKKLQRQSEGIRSSSADSLDDRSGNRKKRPENVVQGVSVKTHGHRTSGTKNNPKERARGPKEKRGKKRKQVPSSTQASSSSSDGSSSSSDDVRGSRHLKTKRKSRAKSAKHSKCEKRKHCS